MTTLRLILGDQLNHQHHWYQQCKDDVMYVLMEMKQETDYVTHHIQKVTAFFLAMRAFAAWLQANGHKVKYITLDDPANTQSLTQNLALLLEEHRITHFQYQFPDEYRLDQQLINFCKTITISSSAVDSDHFLSTRNELANFFSGKKQYLMESFYRYMRKKHHVMMQANGEPWTDRWNYDQENRAALPKNIAVPIRFNAENQVDEIKHLLQKCDIKTIGNLQDRFRWPVSREQALMALDDFLHHGLPTFGKYQDAMHTDHAFLFHSLLSFPINVKLLHPREVIDAAIAHWQNNQANIPIAALEGFVRQIIGWREYMRGVYWAHMPSYAEKNFFGHTRPLPDWFWTGNTKMNCLSHAIGQSLDHAYAHHIQRLMITGNFALLAGINPTEVDEWYLGIYIDAIEWVEITNTRGMSQYADGGLVATKPYVSSGAYIHKMSNYCTKCHYDVKQKTGEKACPFNALYWHFYDRNRALLQGNPRIGMAYVTWDKMDSGNKQAIMKRANEVLENLERI